MSGEIHCRTKDGAFLKLSGNKSRDVTLTSNDLGGVAKPAEVAPDAAKDALVITVSTSDSSVATQRRHAGSFSSQKEHTC